MIKKYSKNALTIAFLVVFGGFLLDSTEKISKKLDFTSKSDDFSEKPLNYSQNIKKIAGKARITDGDSIIINGEKIRLLYIDAPEYKQKCHDKNHKKYSCGIKSTDFLSNFIDEREILCYYRGRGTYNRILAECFIGEISINNYMVKNGMAVIYSYNNADKELKNFQKIAKAQKLGIWQGKFELPKNYRKRLR